MSQRFYTVEIYDIDYEKSSQSDVLPECITFSTEAADIDELEDLISEHITEKTGHWHQSFDYRIIR